MATHNSNRHRRTDKALRQHSLHRQLLLLLPAALLLTHMLFMAATRTIWQCGMLPLLSNNKAVKVLKDPQAHNRHVVAVTDACVAEPRRMLPVCMIKTWILLALA